MSLGTSLLRVAVGGFFVGHGLQKLNGSFGGPGLDATEQTMKGLGLHPGRQNAFLAAATETVGGAGVLLGAATPLAAAGLVGSMVTAIRKVHAPNGPWNHAGGYEYNAVLIAGLAAIASGPGRVSIDAFFGKKKWGVGGALFALAAGVAASTAIIRQGEKNAPLEAEDAE